MRHRLPPLLLGLVLPMAAAAQDEPIEIADDPFEITDPIAAAPGAAEISVVGAYERARRGRVRDTVAADTEIEFGVVPGLEFRVGQTGAFGNLETRRRLGNLDQDGAEQEGRRALWGGATRLGALVQLAGGQGARPAIGLLGRVRTLYGRERPAYETETALLIGHSQGQTRPLGLHLNLGWVSRLDPEPGERPNRYLMNASIGQAIALDTALVVTYAHEQQERGDHDFSLVQAGLRQRLPGGRAVLGLAAGFGLNRDSPRFQLAFLQWQLSGGWR